VIMFVRIYRTGGDSVSEETDILSKNKHETDLCNGRVLIRCRGTAIGMDTVKCK